MNIIKIYKNVFLIFLFCSSILCFFFFFEPEPGSKEKTQAELKEILLTQELEPKQRYTIINQMANALLSEQDYQGVILLLTNWVEENPDDMYNSYWLLMTAYAYLSLNAEPVAEYYFDRILQTCPDLLVKGNSIHFMCLQNLIQISKTPSHRIKYFKYTPKC